jgi:hypothetical protein
MFPPFGFSIQEFIICYFYCQKTAVVCEFQHVNFRLVEIDDFLKVPHIVWT